MKKGSPSVLTGGLLFFLRPLNRNYLFPYILS